MSLRPDPKDIKAIATAYFYRRSNLSDFALGVDSHLVGYNIYHREVLGHQDDGDIIIPPDLSEELLHLQSQGVIRDRKGLLREEEVGGKAPWPGRIFVAVLRIFQTGIGIPRNRPSHPRGRPPPPRLRSPPGLSAISCP